MHVLIVFTSLPNQVVDRLPREQTFKAFEVLFLAVRVDILILIESGRKQPRAPYVAIVPTLLTL
jgi:hypothetical protein